MTWLVMISKDPRLDSFVFNWTNNLVSRRTTDWMIAFSFLGKHSFLVPANLALITYFLLKKEVRTALATLFISLSSLGLMTLLKRIFQRSRPSEPLVEGITNFSFPSGHAFMSVAFYGLLIWWVMVSVRQKWLRRFIIFFLATIIITIGFSRIYLRVHYTTDVIAGFCIGTFWLTICLSIFAKKNQGL